MEQTPQAKADILKAEEPVEDIMEPVASEKLLKVDGQNNPLSTVEKITVDAVSCEDNQQKGRTEPEDGAADPVPDEQMAENTSILDAGENISNHLLDFAFFVKLLKESDIKGMELAACKEDPHMEKDHDAETIHIRPELKEGRLQAYRTEEEEIQMMAADPNIQNINMKFENVEESDAAGNKFKSCGPNDAIQSTEEEKQQEENATGIAMATEEAGRQKTEQEYEKLEQKLDIALSKERSLEPDEASFGDETVEDKKTQEKSMLASEIPTASKRDDIDNGSPAEKPAELPVVQALIKEILQKGKAEDVKLKPEEKNAQEQILIGNVDAEMIEQENLNEPPPTEAAVEAEDNRKFYKSVESGIEMANAREKNGIEISAAAEIKEAKLDIQDMNSQKAESELKKLEQDAAIAVAEKSHEKKEQSTEAEEVHVTETKTASSSLSEVSSVGKGKDTDIESPEEKSGELPVIQTLVKEILQKDEMEENKHEHQSQPVSVEKKAELVMTGDEIMDAREEQILIEVQVQDNQKSNEKVNHCCHKIKGENTEAMIPWDGDVQEESSLDPDASPTSEEFPSHKEDDKQTNRVSKALSSEPELSIANEDTSISETVRVVPAKASDLASKDQEVQRMAEVEIKIGEDLVDDSPEEVFQEFSELKTGKREQESADVSLRTEEPPVMLAIVEEGMRQGEIEGKKPEKAAHAVIEEESAQSITMTENSAANIPEENPPEAHPLETPDIQNVEDTGNLDGEEPTTEVPDKENTKHSGKLQNQKERHSLETTDATHKIETMPVLDEEIQDREFNVLPVEPVAQQASPLEKQREEPNIIPEIVPKEKDFDASSSGSSEIGHGKATVSDGAVRDQETGTKTEAESSCRQMRIDDSSVQKLLESSELKSDEEKITLVPENEREEDQNPGENETGVEYLEDVFLQKEDEYDELGESEPTETGIATGNKIHFAENESPSLGEYLIEQTAEAAFLIGSDKKAERKCEETAATNGTYLQIKGRESDTFEKTKEISPNAEMAEPFSKKDESDVEKLDETLDGTSKEVEAAGERADMGKEVLENAETCTQEARKESKLLEHEAAGLPNIPDISTNQTPNEEKTSRAAEPTDKNEREEANTEENPHQNNDSLPNSDVEAEETMQKERSDTLDQISDTVPEEQQETIDENKNIQFDNSREDTQPDKFNKTVLEDNSYNTSSEKGEEEAEEKLCKAVAVEENKTTDSTTSESRHGTVNVQDGKETDSKERSEKTDLSEDQKETLQKEDSLRIVLLKKEKQCEQTEEQAGTVTDSLLTAVHSKQTKGEIQEEGMIKGMGSATAREERVETSFEVSHEPKLPKEAKAEPDDDVRSFNAKDNSETTSRHKVSEEPRAAAASNKNEIEKDTRIDEDANSLPAACERPNETVQENEKKHQEETSQLVAEEKHCEENNKSDSTKEGHNKEDKDTHALPEGREFSNGVTNKNVDIMPLKIVDRSNEVSDASLFKNEYTDEPIVRKPDRFEGTSGGAKSQKKMVEKDTIVESSRTASVQDESLAESQSTRLEVATPNFKSEDQTLKINDTFKMCKATSADESVERQTTQEDGAVRKLDASVTKVGLEEKLEDEHKKLNGTRQKTVADQKYEVKDSILVSKEQEFKTTYSAEEIEMANAGGEQKLSDIADALSFQETLNIIPEELGTTSGEQDTQDIDKQVIPEDITSKGVDEAKSMTVVEDQGSQANDIEKIPNKQVCEVVDATKEDGSGKELDASSTTTDVVVTNNLPADKKLEEGQTQAEDHIFKSNDEGDLTTTSQTEVKASEVPEEWEIDETGSAGMVETTIAVADNEVNEMTNISTVISTSTQLDKASEGLETSSKCEDIHKQMMENVDLIEGGHEVVIEDELIPGSEESQKPNQVKASILVSQKEFETRGSAEGIEMATSGGEQNQNEIAEALSSETTTEKLLNTVSGRLGTASGEQESQDIGKQVTQEKVTSKGLNEEKSMQVVKDQSFQVDDRAKIQNKQVSEVVDAMEEDGSPKDLDAISTTTVVVSNNLPEDKKLEEAKIQAEDQIFKSNDEIELTTTRQNKEVSQAKASEVVPGKREFEENCPIEIIGTMIPLAGKEINEITNISPVIPTLTQLDKESEGPDTSRKCEDIHEQTMENVDLIKGNCDVLIKDELAHEIEESQKPEEAIKGVEALRHHIEDEPIHDSRDNPGPKEDVPDVKNQRLPEVEAQGHHAKGELVHESEESQKPKEAMLEVEAHGHRREHEPVHESRESQRPEEVVPEVETQSYYIQDEAVYGSEGNQKTEEVVPDVETHTHHAEDETVHESEESQKPEAAALEVESKENQKLEEVVHKVENERCPIEEIHERNKRQRPGEVVPEVEAQKHHISEERQKLEEVVPEVEAIPKLEAQRYKTEEKPIYGNEERQKPMEDVPKVETQRYKIEDEPAQESKENKHKEVVLEVESERHHTENELVHEHDKSQKPEETMSEIEAQRHHSKHEPVHENSKSQKSVKVLPGAEIQRHHAEDESTHGTKESEKFKGAIPQTETEMHSMEEEIVHENEERQKLEEVVPATEDQSHHTKDELVHKIEERENHKEVVLDVEAQSQCIDDVLGKYERIVENKDTEIEVVKKEVATKDLNSSTIHDASVVKNFHEDSKEKTNLEGTNDTAQDGKNKEVPGGYGTIIENNNTETYVLEEAVAAKNLNPSSVEDASVEENFNENFKELETVLEVEDECSEANDTTQHGLSKEVKAAELEQELQTRELIDKLEIDRTILDKDVEEIVDTSLAEAAPVENLLYASSEATVTTDGNEEVEKQMIAEECTVKSLNSASLEEEPLQEKESKKLNEETSDLETTCSYNIDDSPDITDMHIKVPEATSKFENAKKQTIEDDRDARDIDTPSNQHKEADNFGEKQEKQKKPNESEGEGQQSEVNDIIHTNNNGQCEEAGSSNFLPIEENIKRTASAEKSDDVTLESNNHVVQVVISSVLETLATEKGTQEGEKHLEATSIMSKGQETKDCIHDVISKEDNIAEKLEATLEPVSEEQGPTKTEVSLHDDLCETVEAFHDSPASIREFTEEKVYHIEVDGCIKEVDDVSERIHNYIFKEEQDTNDEELEQQEKTYELGSSEVIREQSIAMDDRENETGEKDEILSTEMERNGTESEDFHKPSQKLSARLETAIMSINTEIQNTVEKEVCTDHDAAYFEVEASKQTESQNDNKSMKVEEATTKQEPKGLCHETKEANDYTVQEALIKEAYLDEEAGSSKDVEQKEEGKDDKENEEKAAKADGEPECSTCKTKEVNHTIVKKDSVEKVSLEIEVAGSTKGIEQKLEEEKEANTERIEEGTATADFEAKGPSCHTKEANNDTIERISMKQASLEVEVAESSKDVEQKADERKQANKDEAKGSASELQAEGPCYQKLKASNNAVEEDPTKETCSQVEVDSPRKSSKHNGLIVNKENDGAATAELEPEGPSCRTNEENTPIKGVSINFMASSEPAAAGTENDSEQKTEEGKEATKEKPDEATSDLEPKGPNCEEKEVNGSTVKGVSVEEVKSENEVDGTSKDRELMEEEEEVKEAITVLKTMDTSREVKQEHDINMKKFSIDEVSLQHERDGSSKDSVDEEKDGSSKEIVEEEKEGSNSKDVVVQEKEAKYETVEEATTELKPTYPSLETKEKNDTVVEGISIKEVSLQHAGDGSSKDIAEEEKDGSSKDIVKQETEAKNERAEETKTELKPTYPSLEIKETNDTMVEGISIKELPLQHKEDGSSEDIVEEEKDGSSKDVVEQEKEATDEIVEEATTEMKPTHPSLQTKETNDTMASLQHEGDGSSKDIVEKDGSSKDIEEQEKEVDNETIEEATTEFKPTCSSLETKETNDTVVEGISIIEVSSDLEINGSIRDTEQNVAKEEIEAKELDAVSNSSKGVEQKVEEEKETDKERVEEGKATADFEAEGPGCQTKEANNDTTNRIFIQQASLEGEVADSSKDIEQKVLEGKEDDIHETEEPTAHLQAQDPSYEIMEATNSSVMEDSVKEACLEVEVVSSSKDNELTVENNGSATALLVVETKGPSSGKQEVRIPTVLLPINFTASSELADAGTNSNIEEKIEGGKEGTKERAKEATIQLEPEGSTCEEKEVTDTTVKGVSIEVSSALEVDGLSKDREKLKEATTEVKPTGPSSEMKEVHDIKLKEFPDDEVPSDLEGDGSSKDMLKEETDSSSKDIVEEEEGSSRKGIVEEENASSNKDIVEDEKVEESTTELNPTGPSSKRKEGNDVMAEGNSIKEVSSAFEVDGSVKDSEQKVEKEKEAKELDVVSVRESAASFNTECPEDAAKHVKPTEMIKDFNSAAVGQKLPTLETTVPDDKNDVDRNSVGKEGTNLKENDFLDMISDSSASIGSSCNDILQKENATVASSSEAEGNNHAKVDEEEARASATEQAMAEEIKLKEEVKMEPLKEVMNDESNDNETRENEECQDSGLDFSPVPNASATKISENEGTKPEQTSNLVSEKIQETIGTNDIKGIYILRPKETRDIISNEKEKVQKRTIENEWETSKVVVEEGPEEDQALAETTTQEGKEEIENFVIINNSVSDEKIHDAVPEPKEVKSSKTDENTKKSSLQTSGEEITQKEGSKNVDSTEILQANNSDTPLELGEQIERTTEEAIENLKLEESSHIEQDLEKEKAEEERQDGTAEKRMETTSKDLIEELKELDADKIRLSDLLERSQREKMKLGESLEQEGHQVGKEDEVQNKQEATGQADEEKRDEEEDDDHKKDESGSDAPVIVEAARDIDLKPAHKKSHNILSGVGSKVKHSIAKVRKAITGKSTHQKSQSAK